MTDIHTHIIFDVDDGSNEVKESLEIIDKLSFLGFNNIICTPHFIEGTEYNCDNKEKEKKLKMLQKNSKVNLYIGNEIYINPHIHEYIESGNIMPINKKYLLIELPMNNEIKDDIDIFYELQLKGYIIILAHPERYTYFQKDYQKVEKYRERGILFQSNYDSIDNAYGRSAKKLFKYLLKKEYVDYLSTDVHHASSLIFKRFNKMEKRITKITGEDYYHRIVDNGDRLIK